MHGNPYIFGSYLLAGRPFFHKRDEYHRIFFLRLKKGLINTVKWHRLSPMNSPDHVCLYAQAAHSSFTRAAAAGTQWSTRCPRPASSSAAGWPRVPRRRPALVCRRRRRHEGRCSCSVRSNSTSLWISWPLRASPNAKSCQEHTFSQSVLQNIRRTVHRSSYQSQQQQGLGFRQKPNLTYVVDTGFVMVASATASTQQPQLNALPMHQTRRPTTLKGKKIKNPAT